jgi:heme/copper-type cytochrome/quinol oxidase subunit 4
MLAGMRDVEYQPDEIGAYGATAQPAIAARMAPHLRMVQAGAVSALAGVVCAAVALIRFPSFDDGPSGSGWAVTALLAAIAVLAGCVIQVAVWQRAMSSWRGERMQDLHGEARLSWITHLLSYLLVLVALLACIAGSAYATWSATSATLLALEALFVLVAQMLAGVQFLRPSGPPGTLPTHIRRIVRLSQRRVDRTP